MYLCRQRLSTSSDRTHLALPGLPMLRRTFLVRTASLVALPLIALAASPVRPVAETSTTIILVRHGEKTAEPKEDPTLTPAGEARAMALADVVRGAGISATRFPSRARTYARCTSSVTCDRTSSAFSLAASREREARRRPARARPPWKKEKERFAFAL